MYIVRLRYDTKHGDYIANDNVIVQKAYPQEAGLAMRDFTHTLQEAKGLYMRLIGRLGSEDDGFTSVAIVRISRYHPWPEITVLEYKEAS